MKMADITTKTVDELKALLLQSKKELFNLRFQRVTGELENTSRFRQVRRTIARIQTALTAKNKTAA
jgi:large subunit ribosomal protein L29